MVFPTFHKTYLCSIALDLLMLHNYFLTFKELVFAVQENLGQQVEATVLNLMGACVGIALSTLARYLASLCPDDSASARTIPAIFLILICFMAGWAKSRLPRLQRSARISCFASIWILTTNVGSSYKVLGYSFHLVWISLSSAIICLFSSMLLLHWFSTQFAREIASAFSQLHATLSTSLDLAFCQVGAEKAIAHAFSRHQAALNGLLLNSIMLNATYSQAVFDLRVGRLSVKSIKPLLGIVEHLRRELSWGGALAELQTYDENTLSVFQAPAVDLGHAILASIKAVENCVLACYKNPLKNGGPRPSTKLAIADARAQLTASRDAAREDLKEIFDKFDMDQRASLESARLQLSRELADCCLFMISLLQPPHQMAQEMRHALLVAEKIVNRYDNSHTRLWYPRFSWAWLGVAPPQIMLEDLPIESGDPDYEEPESHLSMAEAREGLAERALSDGSGTDITLTPTVLSTVFPPTHYLNLFNLPVLISRLWTLRPVLRARLALSKVLRSVQHSSHLQHAIKNAIGVALLSLPAFFPVGSRGQHWFATAHGQWMIISYVWVLETSMGATWRVGYLRISGTILGALYAYITWLICKTNPYGLVIMVTAADIPISWLIVNTRVSSLGVVASITLPPILFNGYLDPTATTPVIILAVMRALLIGGGIIAALLMNTLLFPRHCRVLFLYHASRTLGLLSQLYLILGRSPMLSELFQRCLSFTAEDRTKTYKLELQIRSSLYRLSLLIDTMNAELSLLPKPMRLYRKTVSTLQNTLDLMTGLRKVRENIPVKETVSSVFSERREFVSCICLTLYSCEHAFRARQPLPQFLPSGKHALEQLISQMEEYLRNARSEDSHALGLSIVYAFAESEILEDLVDTMEDLLDICRSLFGTAAWLVEVPQWAELTVNDDGPSSPAGRGWYSTL
ncbi:hypothetical protein EW146_g8766 [Bondarzewia mesenterica]|uniref:Integral membrane bound transporter domain-containing protein n=1 Tax=Bondarzewia mesenterica TaxID=1095465 RepID=A0A4S4LBR0_9AGAM|nr:hypothetical protein EW146_g8766 [Bondarzewia mesenterica]